MGLSGTRTSYILFKFFFIFRLENLSIDVIIEWFEYFFTVPFYVFAVLNIDSDPAHLRASWHSSPSSLSAAGRE